MKYRVLLAKVFLASYLLIWIILGIVEIGNVSTEPSPPVDWFFPITLFFTFLIPSLLGYIIGKGSK